jgi:hypothetical protein
MSDEDDTAIQFIKEEKADKEIETIIISSDEEYFERVI